MKGPKPKPLLDRFYDKVEFGESCWEWLGVRGPNGYGRIFAPKGGSRMRYAHRVSYEIHVGPIPDGLCIDHLCRNRACVNPSHLEPVTHAVNNMRGVGLGAKNAAKVECIRGHRLTQENLLASRSCRVCRVCVNEKAREKKRKMREAGKVHHFIARCHAVAYWDVPNYDQSVGSEAAVVSNMNLWVEF